MAVRVGIEIICCKAHEIFVFSKRKTERVCRQVWRELELFVEDGDQDIGNEAANLGCIRELLRIACGRTFRVGYAMAGAKEPA